ncbi:hypothetical protein HKX48_004442 [Thoreauomyces humboldtii]|nr:hypothetical protein HKX48_004442 [Thoreauomyces humboldtii]
MTKRPREDSSSDFEDEDEDLGSEYGAEGLTAEQLTQRSDNALKVPVKYDSTFQELFDGLSSINGNVPLIDTSASYQREVVWNDKRQSHLIESIIKNYPIPNLIFAVSEIDGNDHKTVIDGKQRLTSIYQFMIGAIPSIDSKTGHKLWYQGCTTKGRRARNMTPDERREFGQKAVTCVHYRHITTAQQQDIFARVQLGVALSSSEKLYALPGRLGEYIRELMMGYSQVLTQVNTKRKVAFLLLVQVWIVVHDRPNSFPTTTNSRMLKALLSDEDLDEDRKTLMDNILYLFQELYIEDRDRREDPNYVNPNGTDPEPPLFGLPEKLAPIEFVMCAYLFSMNMTIEAPTREDHFAIIREKIIALRGKTRAAHVDVRANTRLYRFMKEIVEEDATDGNRVKEEA